MDGSEVKNHGVCFVHREVKQAEHLWPSTNWGRPLLSTSQIKIEQFMIGLFSKSALIWNGFALKVSILIAKSKFPLGTKKCLVFINPWIFKDTSYAPSLFSFQVNFTCFAFESLFLCHSFWNIVSQIIITVKKSWCRESAKAQKDV